MTTEYFLGANSGDGFASLYGGFCCAPGDFLYIIKGGPGGGKSRFMRRIGRSAEERGLDVEYILCSGDPDSLDGVYIPELSLGFADGTADFRQFSRSEDNQGNNQNYNQFRHADIKHAIFAPFI